MPSDLLLLKAHEESVGDRSLAKLAAFLGIPCRSLVLKPGGLCAESLSSLSSGGDICYAVSAPVLQSLVRGSETPRDWLRVARYALVFDVRPCEGMSDLLRALTGELITDVERCPDAHARYTLNPLRKDVSREYAGLEFGPVEPTRDYRLRTQEAIPPEGAVVSIDGAPMFAEVEVNGSRLFLLATEAIQDIDETVDRHQLEQLFSALVPAVMFLRHVFGEQCWHAPKKQATFMVDDPLLTPSYGFLNYRRLHEATTQIPASTCIAFIPYNWKRSNGDVVDLFKSAPDRYTLCIHGDDHTGAELGTRSAPILNARAQRAAERMTRHEERTGIRTHKVMAIPQEIWTEQALHALKVNNYLAATSSKALPEDHKDDPVIADLLSPAYVRHGGFPLLLRKYANAVAPEIVAFWFCFGKPMIIVTHHDFFRNGPAPLAALANMVNEVGGDVTWHGLADIAQGLQLMRRDAAGCTHLRVFSRSTRLQNTGNTPTPIKVEKREDGAASFQVRLDESSIEARRSSEGYVHLDVDVPPGSERKLEFEYANDLPLAPLEKGLAARVRVCGRRILSEFRDNWLAKNPRLLALAKSIVRTRTPT